ncbi:MAG: hypothetical protein K2F60_03750 [Oscillospiraceae bacterium]|nr:hypothetical protein [Oscillospiraceae bacterium]
MFSRITGEFEQIEFAEFAAKHIRETVSGTKRITIYNNQNKYNGHLQNHEQMNATHGDVFYLLPTAINSYNYITAQVSRSVNDALIPELLLTQSVKIEVISESDNRHKILQILLSEGGYDIKVDENYSNKK